MGYHHADSLAGDSEEEQRVQEVYKQKQQRVIHNTSKTQHLYSRKNIGRKDQDAGAQSYDDQVY